jgi:hypothetical protein
MSLIFANKVKTNQSVFLSKVMIISQNLVIDPNWLMTVMNFESGLDPQKTNPISGAVGLIQFMPATAQSLGTSIESLRKMTNVQQLDYVYKYLLMYRSKIKSFIDLYFAVFFPLAIDKPLDFIIEAKNLSRSIIAKQNPVFDRNKDGKLTVAEIQDTLFDKIPVELRSLIKKK